MKIINDPQNDLQTLHITKDSVKKALEKKQDLCAKCLATDKTTSLLCQGTYLSLDTYDRLITKTCSKKFVQTALNEIATKLPERFVPTVCQWNNSTYHACKEPLKLINEEDHLEFIRYVCITKPYVSAVIDFYLEDLENETTLSNVLYKISKSTGLLVLRHIEFGSTDNSVMDRVCSAILERVMLKTNPTLVLYNSNIILKPHTQKQYTLKEVLAKAL